VGGLLELHEAEAKAGLEGFEAAYRQVFTLTAALLATGALAALGLAWLTIRGIGGAIRQVQDAAGRLAEGELGARVSYRARDELAQVAVSFNAVGERFQAVVQDLSGAIGQLASAAEETANVTTQTSTALREQRSETDQVATAVNEMNATVHEVARNAAQAAEAARQADDSARQGREVVRRTMDTIEGLAREVEKATEVIQRLEKESEGIGTVLDVIKGIAEQTNLLALNAAIEAARAGESGRGFAVVADEVRTLASRTQQSTREIQEMIGRLQAGASNAVQVMESGRTQTRSGVDQAAEAGVALERIAAAVDRITEMNTQIASAAEEQSAVAEEISRNVSRISQAADTTAAGAEQTVTASGELARLAEHLQGLVRAYRV
jgi:methyl-accepting chemotaxis protein